MKVIFRTLPQEIFFLILPIFLLIILLSLVFATFFLNFWLERNPILSKPFEVRKEALFPLIKNSFTPKISATAAIIMDADSKIVLYSKNPQLRSSTASTAKLMTALVGLDYFNLDDMLVVKNATDEGSLLGLKKNQKLTFESLLYALLLPSANDAAFTIAQNYKGEEKGFMQAMNIKANKFDLYNTHFQDPAGLADDGDYTTPFDLARLASFSMQNETIRNIVGTKEKVIYDQKRNAYKLKNLNELLGISGVNGVKTGYTEEAGQVLVTSKDENGKNIIIVVMGSEDRFSDTEMLIDLVNNNLTYLSIHP